MLSWKNGASGSTVGYPRPCPFRFTPFHHINRLLKIAVGIQVWCDTAVQNVQR